MGYRSLFFNRGFSREWEITYEYTNWEGKRVTESRIEGGSNLEEALNSVESEFKDPKWGYKMLYFEEYYGDEC